MAAIPMVAVAAAPVPKTGPASSSTECLIPHRLGSRWTTSWTDPVGFDARDDKETMSVRMWGGRSRGKKAKTNSKATLGNSSSDEDKRRWTSPAPASSDERRHTFGYDDAHSLPKKKRYSFVPARMAPAPPPEAPPAASAEAAHASALAKLTASPPSAPRRSSERNTRRFSLKSLPARPPTPEAIPPAPLLSLKDVKGGMSFAAEGRGGNKRGWGEYDAFGAVPAKLEAADGHQTPPKANPFDGGFTPVSPNLGEERRAKRLSRHVTGERVIPPPLPAPADMIAATSPSVAEQRAERHRSAPVGRPVTRTLRRKPAPKADEDLLQSESGPSGQTTPPSAVGGGSASVSSETRPGAAVARGSGAGEATHGAGVAAAAAAALGAAAFAPKSIVDIRCPSPAALGAAAFNTAPAPVADTLVNGPQIEAASSSATTPSSAVHTASPLVTSPPAPRDPVAQSPPSGCATEGTCRDSTMSLQSDSTMPAAAHARQSSVSSTGSLHTALTGSSAAVTAPSSPVVAAFAPPAFSEPAATTAHLNQHQHPARAPWPILPVVPISTMPPERSRPVTPVPSASPILTSLEAQVDLATPRAAAAAASAAEDSALQDSALLPSNESEPIAPALATVAAHHALTSAMQETPTRKALAISTPPRRAPIPAAWQSQASLLVPDEERASSTTPPATAESGIFPQHRDEFVDACGPEGFVVPPTRNVPGTGTGVVLAATRTHAQSSSTSSSEARFRLKPSDIAQTPPYSPPRRAAAPMPSAYAYDRPANHARAAESLRARHGLSPEPPEEARHLRVSAYGVPELDFTRTPPPEPADDVEVEAQGRSSSEREVLQTPALGGSTHTTPTHTYTHTQTPPSQLYIQPIWPRSRGHSRTSSASRSTTSAASAAPPSVSAFTDRLPRNFEADGGGVEGLLSAQHTGTTKGGGSSSGMATVESSPRAPSWIDHARPPKILELEAAVVAAAAAASKPFPTAGTERLHDSSDQEDAERARAQDASTTPASFSRAERESHHFSLVGTNGPRAWSANESTTGHERTTSSSNGHGRGNGSAFPPALQPVFNAPPPPLHSPSAPPPPAKDHFGKYPAGHTYAAAGAGSAARATSPPAADPPYHGSLGRAAVPPFGASRSSRPQTAGDASTSQFGSLSRSSRPSTAGAPSSHPFNAVRTPSSAEKRFGSLGRSWRPTERATSPIERATSPLRSASPFTPAQWEKLQPINAAHASTLARLENASPTPSPAPTDFSLTHEAHPHPPPSFPGARASPEPRRRFSFRPGTGSGREKRKKRFSLLPERKSFDISAPVPASDAPLPAGAWPAGGVGSRLSGIAQTPLPPPPAVSAMAVGTPRLSMQPDALAAPREREARDASDIPERPESAASRRSRRWSFKPGKKQRQGEEQVPPVPALPPVLPLPSSFNEAKGMHLFNAEAEPEMRVTPPQVEVEEPKKKRGGKFMRSLRGLFKH
ncbi:hypothetical protein CC85DRAFT_330261 [Cutaneotrichosporon oleaginosum]|uniref:Uncharacterized protein n=1 Tax=Cutaneotrichosporon oleaginosum TaxID=879819 RepID=A0A0J0XG71_9TREE|nr:uncharacterized protein CC85DRAFT_330261 [Cutaneotrichosporon oleaginosum]KLT40046.1 hypothetical protein CC85DRAFT_330261 [Cutaneotrichosporon oleaginosum]TXT13812.1 hypothetical protein COLE_00005 [Cutaneotrichosporon oleaginosum]